MDKPGSDDPMKGQYGIMIDGQVRQNVWTELGELQLWITNKRKTRCMDCGGVIEARLGIRLHFPFRKSGFVCHHDARQRIVNGGGVDGNYRVDVMGNLGPALGGEVSALWRSEAVAASLIRMENGKPIKVE